MRKIILFFLFLSATMPSFAQFRVNFGSNSPLRKIQIAELAISNLYVDSVNEDKLAEDAIRGMLEKLDPHSTYTTAKETKELTESLQGSFEGIGVQYNMVRDTLLVIQTVVNGPSEKAGIVAGDRIIAADGKSIAGQKMSKEEIMRCLRGPKGSKVKLSVLRRGIDDVLTFVVTRDKIPVETVDASYMIRPEVGYIRIGSFGMTTHEEFMKCIQTLKANGMRYLILDLQDNGGGYLQAAVQIANEFLQKNDLIVYTEGRAAARRDYNAVGGQLSDIGLMVLVNEISASASEIVAGAIQDYDRGVIIGRRSFGKGLVQRPVEFPDGSMMRLTIAHYFTPSGRCIQKPYTKGDTKDYDMELNTRFEHGELYNADSIHFADSLRCETLHLHRTIYGGGGIMPDVFVPLDTMQYTKFHRQLAAKSIILNASLKYVDDNRKSLKRNYPTFDAFKQNYSVPQTLLDEIYDEGAKQKIKPSNDAELQRTEPYLRAQLKALVARDIWNMDEYFAIINEQNHIVQQAVNYLTSPTRDSRLLP